jgi:hypothetical protein
MKQFHFKPYQNEVDKMLDNLNVKKRKKGKNTEGVEEFELV